MLQHSLQTVSVLVVGRFSSEALTVAAFSYMFAMATAWLIALGGTSALNTLASSSFTSFKDKGNLGVLLQRAIVVLTGFYVVVAVIWAFSEHLLRTARPTLSPSASTERAFFSSCSQAAGVTSGSSALIITSPLNAVLNYTPICELGLGLYGAPIATGISCWLSFLLLVAYACFVQGSECCGGLSDWLIVKPAKRRNNTKTPEMRLWLAYPAAILAAIGLIVWGVSVDRGYITVGASIQMGNTSVCTYILDAYPLQSIATMTFYAVMLNMSAFVDPFFILPWVNPDYSSDPELLVAG
ncbi:putative transporter-like protein [Hapsidospora chrysogenum ATCC 11550]|uniref:Putative transporter-like protein n=1 Tax=Hapsidospora chrysogenum (strain ATCC 11550 / CBS 779.69 / DSM 880 / IAM 14645 / JCM 23072 / IMI 49137) TaxID=857340 RepID=A0A086T8D3_HAPC1|nr:putative transporter-like protein [Hapsidospora chrysogenum ATCC 11550]